MRILLAFDKFKGSLTAGAVSKAVKRGLQRGGFAGEIEVCPIADGGEGFTDTIVTALGGEWKEAGVHDAQGRHRLARYGVIERSDATEAVMEMSAASGLALVSDLPLDPHAASTRGTGELMNHAIEQGAERIIIGIGGSATNDGGMGMATMMGYDFLTADRNTVTVLPRDFESVVRIVRRGSISCQVLVACDVENPLLGETGATRVYGPQKGVKDIAFFEQRLERLADMVQRDLGCDCRMFPGAGAAGGLGFGLMSFCGARLQPGFDLVAEITGLRERVARADLVITGEGKLDAQTLHGKGPLGVARIARQLGRPVVAVAGIIGEPDVLGSSFDLMLAAKPDDMPLAEALLRAEELVEECVARNAEAITKMAFNR